MHGHQGRRHEELYSRVFIPAVKTFKVLWKTLCKKTPKHQTKTTQTNFSFQDRVSWEVSGLECLACFATNVICMLFRRVHDLNSLMENLLAIKYQIKHTFNFRLISCYSRFCLSQQPHTFGVPCHTFISFVCWGVLLDDTNNYILLLGTSVYEKKNWFLHDQLCCSKQCQMLIAK